MTLDYQNVVEDLIIENKKIYCVAALDDFESAPVCQSVEGIADKAVIYHAGGHGMFLFNSDLDLDPNLGEVILDFILDVFSISN